MSGAGGDTATGRRRVERAAAAGMIAAALFVTVFSADGWHRVGYDPSSMFVSELSLGPDGWIQIASFLVTGALVVVFGRGLAVALTSGPAARAGPILLQVIGISLMVSGPFVTDPSAPSAPVTVHGTVHALFGAVVFSLAPISCFVLHRRFRRDPTWRGLAGWTLAAGIALTAGVVVLKISQLPAGGLFAWKGVVQRAVLVAFFAWLFAVAARLRTAR